MNVLTSKRCNVCRVVANFVEHFKLAIKSFGAKRSPKKREISGKFELPAAPADSDEERTKARTIMRSRNMNSPVLKFCKDLSRQWQVRARWGRVS